MSRLIVSRAPHAWLSRHSLARRVRLALPAALALLAACASEPATAPTAAAPAPSLLVVPITGFTQLSAGYAHNCGITTAGTALCWGLDGPYYDTGQYDIPTDLGTVKQVSAGDGYSCAVTAANALRCWGRADRAAVPSDVGPVAQVAAGLEHACAVTTSGVVRCWGQTIFGAATVPTDLGPAKQVAVGKLHTCAVTTAGGVRCWGTTEYNLGQVDVPATLGPVTQVVAGFYHNCALKTDGTVVCWGSYGAAFPPNDLGKVTQVTSGLQHACALTAGGTVRCWGSNVTGQLNVPTDLGPVMQVSAGTFHTCALRTAGDVRCWGDGPYPATRHVYPTATFTAPATAIVGQPIAVALTNARVPGGYTSTFTYAFDCGAGTYRAASTSASTSCSAATAGPLTVRGKVIDQDGDSTEYAATVTVLTIAQGIQRLRDVVAASGIAADVRRGLTDKLDASSAALARDNTTSACLQLGAFASQVTAQRGKAIARATADAWLDQAAQLRRTLGC